MDFCRVIHAGDPETGEPDTVDVLLVTHDAGDDDMTPLQMISAARLAQLLAAEGAACAPAAGVCLNAPTQPGSPAATFEPAPPAV